MKPIWTRRTRVRSASPMPVQSWPLMMTWPPSGVSSSPAMCSSVDLPAPEGPTSATACPGKMSAEAPFSTAIVRVP